MVYGVWRTRGYVRGGVSIFIAWLSVSCRSAYCITGITVVVWWDGSTTRHDGDDRTAARQGRRRGEEGRYQRLQRRHCSVSVSGCGQSVFSRNTIQYSRCQYRNTVVYRNTIHSPSFKIATSPHLHISTSSPPSTRRHLSHLGVQNLHLAWRITQILDGPLPFPSHQSLLLPLGAHPHHPTPPSVPFSFPLTYIITSQTCPSAIGTIPHPSMPPHAIPSSHPIPSHPIPPAYN